MLRAKIYEGVKLKVIYLLAGALLFVLIYHATRPIIVVECEGKVLFSTAAEVGTEFSIRFIHSVQKTPVEEFFTVNEDYINSFLRPTHPPYCFATAAENQPQFILKSTRYSSLGVGLPFLEGDGNFRREGDNFIMDNLNRSIQTLALRPGVGTELIISIGGQTLPLYEIVPPGSLIRISIMPNYKKISEVWRLVTVVIFL